MLPTIMFKKLMEFEGEYSNHTNDTGGETIYGITIVHEPDAFKLIKKYYDIGRKEHALEIAKIIYDIEYYEKASCKIMENSMVNISIIHQVFDMAVNMGIKTSIKILQRAINQYNENNDLKIDGCFGIKTLTALTNINNDKLNNLMVNKRIEYYNKLCVINPENKVFLNGWIKRANYFKIGAI